MKCFFCETEVGNPQESDIEVAKDIFKECQDRFPDLKNKQFGQDGVSAICFKCQKKLAHDHPWLIKYIERH